jgi:two-component system, NarL family, sensor kinase
MQQVSNHIIVILVFTSFLLMLLVAFIISLFFQYEKRQLVYYNNIQQLNLEHENNLLCAQLEIQENTFANISQEIHDNVGLSLTLAKLNINSIKINDRKNLQTLLVNSEELITKAITDLGDLSKSFNADVIISQGLLSSLETEIARLTRNVPCTIQCHIIGEPFYLESRKEVLLFRIFQEAINNVIKHASASKITVKLLYEENKFTFTVADDGKGFDKDQVADKKKSQAGIKNIERRAALMNGTTSIYTEADKGTLITINLPINQY